MESIDRMRSQSEAEHNEFQQELQTGSHWDAAIE